MSSCPPRTSPSVAVVPLVAEPEAVGPPNWRALSVLELTRVPCAGELVRADGELLIVRGVLHTPGAEVTAELHCERLQALPSVAMEGVGSGSQSGSAQQLELGAES